MGLIISTMLSPGTNNKSHVQDSGTLTKFIKNNLKILCHPQVTKSRNSDSSLQIQIRQTFKVILYCEIPEILFRFAGYQVWGGYD